MTDTNKNIMTDSVWKTISLSIVPHIFLIWRNGLSCPHASNKKEKEEEEEGNNLDSICVMAGGINQETAKWIKLRQTKYKAWSVAMKCVTNIGNNIDAIH